MKNNFNKILQAEANADIIISEANANARRIKEAAEEELEKYRQERISAAKAEAENLIASAQTESEARVREISALNKEKVFKQEESFKRNIERTAEMLAEKFFAEFGDISDG